MENKKKNTIIKEIFKIRTVIYDLSQKIFEGNDSEFADGQLTEMCGYLGINLHIVGAESPWR